MRKFVSVGLVLMMTVGGAFSGVAAAQQAPSETATVTGTAQQANLQPLSGARVQIRSVDTGQIVASTTSGQAGEFTFADLQPGNYIIEIIDATARVTGTTQLVTVAPGVSTSVSVTVAAAGASIGSGGFSILGLGPVTSMAVLGAAGAASVSAVVVTRDDASPSR